MYTSTYHTFVYLYFLIQVLYPQNIKAAAIGQSKELLPNQCSVKIPSVIMLKKKF